MLISFIAILSLIIYNNYTYAIKPLLCNIPNENYKQNSVSNVSIDQCIDNDCERVNNQRIIVIGDVHGTYDGLLEILYKANITKSINSCEWKEQSLSGTLLLQIGDIVDRGTQALDCWLCLQYLQSHAPSDSKVIRMVGNHELFWLSGSYHLKSKNDTSYNIKKLVSYMKSEIASNDLLGSYTIRLNNIPIIFTHGGLRTDFIKYLTFNYAITSPEDITDYINGVLKENTASCSNSRCVHNDEVFEAGKDRGGSSIGGPIWTDYSVISQEVNNPLQAIQIVGHTVSHCAFKGEDSQCIRYTDTLSAICVDGGIVYGARSYLEIDRFGHFIIHEKKLLFADDGDYILDSDSEWISRDITYEKCFL